MTVLMPNRAAGGRVRVAAPYEVKVSCNAPRWEPASYREVRYWLSGWTYTAATAVLALDRGEEVETDWCRIRRRKESPRA